MTAPSPAPDPAPTHQATPYRPSVDAPLLHPVPVQVRRNFNACFAPLWRLRHLLDEEQDIELVTDTLQRFLHGAVRSLPWFRIRVKKYHNAVRLLVRCDACVRVSFDGGDAGRRRCARTGAGGGGISGGGKFGHLVCSCGNHSLWVTGRIQKNMVWGTH